MIPPQGNAEFVAAMERVLDIYRRPCDAAFAVVCMDETARQLIGETRTPMCVGAGREGREDYEYRRLGTCNVFMPASHWRGDASPRSLNVERKATGHIFSTRLPSALRRRKRSR